MNNSKVGLNGQEASYPLRKIELSFIDLMTTINSYEDVLNEVANTNSMDLVNDSIDSSRTKNK